MTLAYAILGLLSAVVTAWVKFGRPRREPTVSDRLADVDRELAARDAAAVNARLEQRLRDARGGHPSGPPSDSPRSRADVQSALDRLVGAGRSDAGNPPRTGEQG